VVSHRSAPEATLRRRIFSVLPPKPHAPSV